MMMTVAVVDTRDRNCKHVDVTQKCLPRACICTCARIPSESRDCFELSPWSHRCSPFAPKCSTHKLVTCSARRRTTRVTSRDACCKLQSSGTPGGGCGGGSGRRRRRHGGSSLRACSYPRVRRQGSSQGQGPQPMTLTPAARLGRTRGTAMQMTAMVMAAAASSCLRPDTACESVPCGGQQFLGSPNRTSVLGMV